MCVLLKLCHFLTLRTRFGISKFRVYLYKKNLIDVTVLHYKQYLGRWRASESVLVNESVAIHR